MNPAEERQAAELLTLARAVSDRLTAIEGQLGAGELEEQREADVLGQLRRLQARIADLEAATSPAAPAPRPQPAGWSPCGYPGCSPRYCDDCDGRGYRGRWMR